MLFEDSDLSRANFSQAELDRGRLRKCNLTGANLEEAWLLECHFDDSVLNHANLQLAFITSPQQLDTVRMLGTNFNEAIVDVRAITPSQMEQAGAINTSSIVKLGPGEQLERADLSGLLLHSLVFDGSNLSHADLSECDMTGASLRGCNLSHANFQFAELEQTDLSGADLTGTVLAGAMLRDCKTDGAIFKDTVMPDGTIHDS